jgi:hypothetical protein
MKKLLFYARSLQWSSLSIQPATEWNIIWRVSLAIVRLFLAYILILTTDCSFYLMTV